MLAGASGFIAALSANSLVWRATPSITDEKVLMSASSLRTTPSSRSATRTLCPCISPIASITRPTTARPCSASAASSDAAPADSLAALEACSEEDRNESIRPASSSSSTCKRSTSDPITPTETELRAAPIENVVVVWPSSSSARAKSLATAPVSPGRFASSTRSQTPAASRADAGCSVQPRDSPAPRSGASQHRWNPSASRQRAQCADPESARRRHRRSTSTVSTRARPIAAYLKSSNDASQLRNKGPT